MVVRGIPFNRSKDFITKFLHDKIPNVKNVDLPIDREKGTTTGIGFVELSSEANVKDVLSQVKRLELGSCKLRIYEKKPREERSPSGGRRFHRGRLTGSFNGNSRGIPRGFEGFSSSRGGSRSDNNQRDSRLGGPTIGGSPSTSFGTSGSVGGQFGGLGDFSYGRDNTQREYGFGNTNSGGGGFNQKRDQQQSSFSSYQNDKKEQKSEQNINKTESEQASPSPSTIPSRKDAARKKLRQRKEERLKLY